MVACSSAYHCAFLSCLLWVISRHVQLDERRPLHPGKKTWCGGAEIVRYVPVTDIGILIALAKKARECAYYVVGHLSLPCAGDLEFTRKTSFEHERCKAVHHRPAGNSKCLP